MIIFLLLTVYVIGYFVTGVLMTKGCAELVECCGAQNSADYQWRSRANCKYYCMKGCWALRKTPVTVGDAAASAGLSLVWPLLVPPFLFYQAASYERKPKGLTQAELARLDRVLDGKEEA